MSDKFISEFEIRWADIDANNHLRHSAYNDYACQARVAIMNAFGLTYQEMRKLDLGPILFREETLFKSEIGLCEKITVECRMSQMSDDGKKWSFMHWIYKEDGKLAATVKVDGAWMDLTKRKLTVPPASVLEKMEQIMALPASQGEVD